MAGVFDSYAWSRMTRFLDEDVGAWVRAGEKKPVAQQAREIVDLWRRYRFFPYQYFKHDLYLREAGTSYRDYIPSVFADKCIDRINPPDCASWLEDKVAFDRRMSEAGLPVIETFALMSIKDGRVSPRRKNDEPMTWPAFLEAARAVSPQAIFVKPRFGGQGRSAHRFTLGEAGLVRDGEAMSEAALARLLTERGFDDFLVQPYFQQHAVMAGLNAGSVNTLRVVTLATDGEVDLVGALLRVGGGKGDTDNWSGGGRIANVSLPSGHVARKARVKRAYSKSAAPQGFDGVVIPYAAEVLDLVMRGARLFAPIRHIGWDIAVGAEGPCVIEANYQSQFLMLQDACGGLRPTAIGRELAAMHKWR